MKIHFTSFLFTLILSLSTGIYAQSQSYSLSGTIIDSTDQSSVIGAYIRLTSLKDTTKSRYEVSDENGVFRFGSVASGDYRVTVSYISYKDRHVPVKVSDGNVELGNVYIKQTAQLLKEVTVVGQAIQAIQKGDTTQYNASAFKTNPDASTEDLIQKMPGISVENGEVKAQGESVRRVLVDGKPFFGDDPSLALRSLPAEVVDKIEVFDRLSDQAQFTGFDDGNAQKTINIITRPNRNTGQFGKIYGGYGLDDRYQAGGNINIFKGSRRISILGLSNNINQQNFSSQDILGATGSSGGRGGRGGGGSNNFMVGQQNGITSTNALGLNYTDNWGKKIEVTGSYFFNRSANNNEQITGKETFLTNQFYDEKRITNNRNLNHRFNLRIDYKITEKTSLLFTPQISLQNNHSGSNTIADTREAIGTALISTVNERNAASNGYNLGGNLLLRHRFDKAGRTISMNLGSNANNQNRTSTLYARNLYYNNELMPGDTIDQFTTNLTDGIRLSANVNYTEPINKTSQLQFSYNTSLSNNNSLKETYNFNPYENFYSSLDTLLSNNFDNRYLTNRGGLGYRFRKDGFFATVDFNYQNAQLASTQAFPRVSEVKTSFNNFLPGAMASYRLKSGNQFRLFYRTATQEPSVSQLQNVINNTNPLSLTAGNPNLKQSYTNTLNLRFTSTNQETFSNLQALVFVSKTNNAITNSTFIARERTEFEDGIILEKGAQLTRPVNVNGNLNLRSLVTYGTPIKPVKLNINFTTGFNYNRTPGLINEISNISNSYIFNQGVVLSSNISSNIDFAISYTGNFNLVRNTIQPQMNNNFYTHVATGRFNWIFAKGFVVSSDISNQTYRGLGEGYNQNFALWNASVGKKFMKNNAGELKLTIFDILKQNNSISRTVSETNIQDISSRVITQYAMLTFTYTLRNFGNSQPQQPTPQRRGNWEGRSGGMGGGGFDQTRP
jgi:hypothetical protein